MDFLNCDGELKGFDVCIDKGTFDAIILNPDNFNDGKKLYVRSLKEALKHDGFFVISSCNLTREQLLDRFSEGEEKMKKIEVNICVYVYIVHVYYLKKPLTLIDFIFLITIVFNSLSHSFQGNSREANHSSTQKPSLDQTVLMSVSLVTERVLL